MCIIPICVHTHNGVFIITHQDQKEWALSLAFRFINSGWVAHGVPFLKWRARPATPLPQLFNSLLDLLLRPRPLFVFHSAMSALNRTLLLPLLSRCQEILEDGSEGERFNATASGSTAAPTPGPGPVASFRETYDNAYFYILFVMVFYSFLAMTLFKCVGSDEEKKDPYEEFMKAGRPSAQKVAARQVTEKFYFEEESGL